MYDFEYDSELRLLRATVSGLMTPEEAGAFARDFEQNLRAALVRNADLKLLIDASLSPVQQLSSFAEVARLGNVFRDPPRTAVVMGSVLAKLQADRGNAHDVVRTFTDMDEALAWLATDPAAAARRTADGR